MPTLDWAGKNLALDAAKNIPYHLLQFVPEESCGDDQNFIVQGDNLVALNSLLPFFRARVKCIYIDPPYNTHSAFEHYDDNFEHAEWLSMMYPRLELLRDFLADDGSIFIQIDDNELFNLKLICDEIFGHVNYVNTIIWKRRGGSANPRNSLNNVTDFILWYSKTLDRKVYPIFSKDDENTKKYIAERFKYTDEDGRIYMKSPIQSPNLRPNLIYDYKGYRTPAKGWSVSREVMEKWDMEGRLAFPNDKSKTINRKIFLDEYKGQPISSLWTDIPVINPMASERLDFEGQKPVNLIERILRLVTDKNSLVLDAFAGSGTSAHAVINLNALDGGARKFILIEEKNYCRTITAERVRRVGGSFKYFTLGEKFFDETGALNPAINFEQLAAYIWFKFTGRALETGKTLPLIGIDKGAAYYLLDGALTRKILESLPAHSGEKKIFASSCRVSEEFLREQGITFFQTPKKIKA